MKETKTFCDACQREIARSAGTFALCEIVLSDSKPFKPQSRTKMWINDLCVTCRDTIENLITKYLERRLSNARNKRTNNHSK